MATAADLESEVLSPQARDFVTGLERRFGARRRALLDARRERQLRLDAGELPDFPKETEELRVRVLNGENIAQEEVRRQRRDGTLIDISTSLSPLRDSSGKIYGYVAIAGDISERKKVEESLQIGRAHV